MAGALSYQAAEDKKIKVQVYKQQPASQEPVDDRSQPQQKPDENTEENKDQAKKQAPTKLKASEVNKPMINTWLQKRQEEEQNTVAKESKK
jgi:hypothetical protein